MDEKLTDSNQQQADNKVADVVPPLSSEQKQSVGCATDRSYSAQNQPRHLRSFWKSHDPGLSLLV
jgi:hypothetical protein